MARAARTGWPTWPSPRCAARSTARRPGRPAVRLLGRRAGPPPTTSASCCPHSRHGLRRRWPTSACPASTSASSTGELLGLMAEAGADVVGVDWRVPLDVARPIAGRRRRHGRAGQPRPGRRACARGPWSRPRSREVLAGNGGQPGPHLQPRPRRAARDRSRACSSRSSSSSTSARRHDRGRTARGAPDRVGVLVMAYGTPRAPDDVEAYYTDIRRGRPPDPRAARRPGRAATTPSAASPRWPSAPRPSAPPCRPRSTSGRPGSFEVVLGQKHAAPFIEDGVADARRARRHRAPSASCWRRTTPPLASASTTTGPRRPPSRTASTVHGIDTGTSSRPTSTSSPPPSAPSLAGLPARHKVLFTAHSLPERVLAVGDPYPDQLRETAEAVAERGRARAVGRLGRRVAERRAHARAVARARHPAASSATSADAGRADGVLVCAQGFVVRPPRGALRPRHRGPPAWPRRPGSPSPAPPCVNDDPDGDGRLPAGARGRRRADARRRMTRYGPGHVVVVGGGITGLAAALTLLDGRPDAAEVTRARGRRPRSAARSRPPRSPASPRRLRRPTPSWPGCPTPSTCASGSAWPTTWSRRPRARLPLVRRPPPPLPRGPGARASRPTSAAWPGLGLLSLEGEGPGRPRAPRCPATRPATRSGWPVPPAASGDEVLERAGRAAVSAGSTPATRTGSACAASRPSSPRPCATTAAC